MSVREPFFDQDEIWRQLADQIGDEGWAGAPTRANAGGWTVILDTHHSGGAHGIVCTRLRAPYVNRVGFRFSTYPQNLLTMFGSLLGLQDVETGDSEFDSAFIVKTNNEASARDFFSSDALRQMMLAQPGIHLEVRDDGGLFGDDFPEGVDELYCHVVGVVAGSRLRGFYDVFALVLDRLSRLGSGPGS